MADIIQFRPESEADDNLITRKPLEMRWGDWQGGSPMQLLKEESRRFEQYREESRKKGHPYPPKTPNHFSLHHGTDATLWALYRWRRDADHMRDVYYLAGLMECMILVPHSILRTVMVRAFYKTLEKLKEELRVKWHGQVHHFLLPMATYHRSENDFSRHLQGAETLQELFQAIREETDEQFLILGSEYAFYLPQPVSRPV
ncbi:MAG: hypothetical protein HY788_14490 [Deltaproteobacteria bacterium]|nr:hypothetical protein [Deltaproteobacteria bacterium]